jgi:hypothetical protein
MINRAIQSNDWDAAITMLHQQREDDYAIINLTAVSRVWR